MTFPTVSRAKKTVKKAGNVPTNERKLAPFFFSFFFLFRKKFPALHRGMINPRERLWMA